MIKNLNTNTIPYICHFPGRSYKKKYGKVIFDYLYTNKITNINIPDNLAIISFKTDYQESLLESQLKNHNNFFSYHISNIKWKHIYRIKLIIDTLKNISHKYILHLDSYDVMFNKPDLSIITDITNDNKIIFNAEKNFYNIVSDLSIRQDIKITFDKIYSSYIYKYLNAGCFFGSRETILYFFEKLLSYINNSSTQFYNLLCDQAAIQLYWYLYDSSFRTNNSIIELDNNCNLFMCMNYCSPTEIQII
jgi:hypothetical protein